MKLPGDAEHVALGCCAYKNVSEFVGDGYFRDMVRHAIEDARRKLADMPRVSAQ